MLQRRPSWQTLSRQPQTNDCKAREVSTGKLEVSRQEKHSHTCTHGPGIGHRGHPGPSETGPLVTDLELSHLEGEQESEHLLIKRTVPVLRGCGAERGKEEKRRGLSQLAVHGAGKSAQAAHAQPLSALHTALHAR